MSQPSRAPNAPPLTTTPTTSPPSQSSTKTERLLEESMRAHAGDPERVLLLERARRFKRSWIDLAEALVRVREAGSFRGWGFASFDDYCTRELHLKRATVDKLCASFGFLRANAPRLARAADRDGRDEADEPADDVVGPIPSWQAVDFVARAERRGAADEETLAEMKRAVFEEGTPMPVLSRRYREVAFPVADEERQARARSQLLATARKLAELVADEDADVPRRLAERVEEAVGELVAALAA